MINYAPFKARRCNKYLKIMRYVISSFPSLKVKLIPDCCSTHYSLVSYQLLMGPVPACLVAVSSSGSQPHLVRSSLM